MALRLGAALRRFWYMHGDFHEGHLWLQSLVQHTPHRASAALAPWSAEMLYGAGVLAHEQGDYAAARIMFQESLGVHRLVNNQRGIAETLNALGIMS